MTSVVQATGFCYIYLDTGVTGIPCHRKETQVELCIYLDTGNAGIPCHREETQVELFIYLDTGVAEETLRDTVPSNFPVVISVTS